MTAARILVVDDNDAIRIVVSEMLCRIGYEVSAADSGENGLNLFLKYNFDIVLSDYEMPGMNGVAMACRIKRNSPGVPVIIMTGSGQASMITRKINAVDEVIAKPFCLDELDATIRNLLEKRFGLTPHAAVE